MTYTDFLMNKTHTGIDHGFDPLFMPEKLFPFQKMLVEWSVKKGRSAVFADCGLGKTFIQLTFAENIVRKTNGRVLVLTPLAVSFQTVNEGAKIGVEVKHRRDGIKSSDKIVVTNYERLHYFNPDDYQAVVCDESSILKNFDGKTKNAITDFMRKRPYRLLCTATAAPNDYIELGTSSEALGEMGHTDMLSMFFKREQNYYRIGDRGGQGWLMRGHAEKDFWRWVCSWARAMRHPSDAGFDDSDFRLPSINLRQHKVETRRPAEGYLFDLPAIGLKEQRDELRRTINERCEMVADLINANDEPAIAWCNLNAEGDLISRLIPDAVQIAGSDPDDKKEEVFSSFAAGKIRVLVTKPTIAGFGLNFQHCAHMTFFPSHSYEQYYQAVRRCWRFGQKRNVTVDLVTTDGQMDVLRNLQRKSDAADKMFSQLVAMMWNELKIKNISKYENKEVLPSWLSQSKQSQIDTRYIAETA